MNFSVLLSLYSKESPEFLDKCLLSLYTQTIQSDDVVLVFDGPVSKELNDVVMSWKERLHINVIKLPKNLGLGCALNKGIHECRNEIIFRMDTDDICHPKRFESQMSYFHAHPEVDIVSGWIAEFNSDIEDVHSIRKVPHKHSDIIKFAKKRSPFNHMAVAYKKSSVINSGGYQADYLYEDYSLWVRMISNGAITYNLQDILVYARTGNGMFVRRMGWKYAISEFNAQRNFYSSGFINLFELVRNLCIRMPMRIMPAFVVGFVYKKILRR